MKILITENQLKRLIKEQSNPFDKNLSSNDTLKSIISKNLDMYKNVIPGIANEYYGGENVQTDAFRHILAAAFYTNKIGPKFTWLGGQSNEVLGAIRSFLGGGPFDSGWDMDSKNNNIGIEIGKQNPNADINELAAIVKKRIDSGNFYTENGTLFNKSNKNK